MEYTEADKKSSHTDRRRYLLPYIILALSITLIDIFSKYLIRANYELGETHNILGSFLRLSYVLNYGGVFGTKIGSNHFYLLSAIIVVALVVYFLLRELGKNHLIDLSLFIVLGGALGNLFDRIRLGAVVDFIDINFFKVSLFGYRFDRWPTFNIADAAVTVGMLILIITVMFGLGYEKKQSPPIEGDSPPETPE